jgi:hypothetical protein
MFQIQEAWGDRASRPVGATLIKVQGQNVGKIRAIRWKECVPDKRVYVNSGAVAEAHVSTPP